jgi:hypothetical protein
MAENPLELLAAGANLVLLEFWIAARRHARVLTGVNSPSPLLTGVNSPSPVLPLGSRWPVLTEALVGKRVSMIAHRRPPLGRGRS